MRITRSTVALTLLSAALLAACVPPATTETSISAPAPTIAPRPAFQVEEGLPVRFSAQVSAVSARSSFHWDFGDGTTGIGETITHTFYAEGTYTVALTAVDEANMGYRDTHVVNVIPYWPTEGWRTSSPEEQGMSSAALDQVMAYIIDNDVAVDSFVVVRHGYIVYEEYRNGYNRTTEHQLQSVTKSFTSMLIGIAMQQGLIESVDHRLVDFFPDHAIPNLDARKESITLENLLTMSDGMDWHELDYPYTDPRNTLGQMWVSSDAVYHVLSRPMARDPGEAWAYNSGTSILLGGILEQVTGQDVLAFAREHLFDPIGIGHVSWSKTRGDHYHTDGGLYMTPRDMARFGYLMLNNGTWDGQEIVSPEWVAQSTTNHYETPYGNGYGYQWWIWPASGFYGATGHYDQRIYVVPEDDLVVIFTANIADEDPHPTEMLMQLYIIPACID